MFGIGMSEMLIILAVALLVFGPAKLPEVAKSIARGLRELRKAGDDLRASIDLDADDTHPDSRGRASPGRTFVPSSDKAPPAQVPAAQAHGEPSRTDAGQPAQGPTDAAPPDELWPRPAEGTLARGAWSDDIVPAGAPTGSVAPTPQAAGATAPRGSDTTPSASSSHSSGAAPAADEPARAGGAAPTVG